MKGFSTSFCPDKPSPDTVRLSKPFEIHPALLVLLVVFFVSMMISLRGGALFPAFTTIIGFVLFGTAAAFLILYALVWLGRKIYARQSIPSKTLTVLLSI